MLLGCPGERCGSEGTKKYDRQAHGGNAPRRLSRGDARRTPWWDSRWAVWLAAGLIVAATVAAYSDSFGGEMVFDDGKSIEDNPTIRRLWPLWRPLCPPAHGETVTDRPLLNLSLAVNYAFGGLDVRGYHATNLAIHLAAALLLFGVVRRTLRLPAMRDRWGAPPPAWPWPSPCSGRSIRCNRIGHLHRPAGRIAGRVALSARALRIDRGAEPPTPRGRGQAPRGTW